ncbi:MAG: hypothetical protein II856_00645 [Bacteroidales bacterium]|nr:hypothetical protein [Bacteroidales bacterium]
MLEIPLAHYVRGGMVRAADSEEGKKMGGAHIVTATTHTSPPPIFFHFLPQRSAPFRQRRQEVAESPINSGRNRDTILT